MMATLMTDHHLAFELGDLRLDQAEMALRRFVLLRARILRLEPILLLRQLGALALDGRDWREGMGCRFRFRLCGS